MIRRVASGADSRLVEGPSRTPAGLRAVLACSLLVLGGLGIVPAGTTVRGFHPPSLAARGDVPAPQINSGIGNDLSGLTGGMSIVGTQPGTPTSGGARPTAFAARPEPTLCGSAMGAGIRSCPVILPRTLASGALGNSSLVPENGTLVGTFTASSHAVNLAYDSSNGLLYVPDAWSNTVNVVNGTSVIASVAVGTAPEAAVYDPGNGWVYVLNYYSSNVSILNGTHLVGTVGVGTQPDAAAYDPSNGYVYLANTGSDNVSVIQGMKLVSTVKVGSSPYGLAVNPSSGLVYVADFNSAAVTILNGTKLAATLTVGSQPDGIAFDPVNGIAYVASAISNTTSLINGTTLVAALPTGGQPGTPLYDPSNGFVYVPDYGSATVTVLNGTKVLSDVGVGSKPTSLAYDAANGFAYALDSASSEVSVLNGSRLATTISLEAQPYNAIYLPQHGAIYVTESGAGSIAIISTLLAEAPVAISPGGSPAGSVDQGQAVTLGAEVWAVGNGNDFATSKVLPSTGLGCASTPTFAITAGSGHVSLPCSPTTPGTYRVWLNVTDTVPRRVSASLTVDVFPAVFAPAPIVTIGAMGGTLRATINETVRFLELAQGGTGTFPLYVWHGVPDGACLEALTDHPICAFASEGTYNVSVSVTDSDGGTSASSAVGILVYGLPLSAALPLVNRPSADIGQTVEFNEAALGGTSIYTVYHWTGFPNGACQDILSATPICLFVRPQLLHVQASVTDSSGTTAVSPTIPFVIYSLPVAGTPQPSKAAADVGETVTFQSVVTGGDLSYSYAWQGLPYGCSGASRPRLTCIMASTGTVSVSVVATDGNGVRSAPSYPSTLVVFRDPTVTAPYVSSQTVDVHEVVNFSVTYSGGSGNYTVAWWGLPGVCTIVGPWATCRPTSPGTYPVNVTLEDGSGFVLVSPRSFVIVSGPPPLPGIPGGAGGNATPGNPMDPPWLVAGLAVALGVVATMAVLSRSRRWARQQRALPPAPEEPSDSFDPPPAEEPSDSFDPAP